MTWLLRRTVRCLIALWASTVTVAAHADTTLPFLDQPPPFHREPLSFLMLLTGEAAAGADAANRRDDGFSVADARLAIGGELHQGFGYFLQANLIDSPALLDLIIHWRAEEVGFQARTGYFRVPVSGELQIGAPFLDMIDRSQIVTAVVPGRQVGVVLDQELLGAALVARGGIFNGNGLDRNDDNRFLYTLRFDGEIPLDDSEGGWVLGYGASGAWSKDRDARLGLDLPPRFRGSRTLGGADVRLSRDDLFVSFEGLYASLDAATLSRRDVWGYQTTIGWDVTRKVQLLARYDAFWAGSLASDLDLAIASVVITFLPPISLQTELRVPTRGADPTPGAVVNLNVFF